MRHLVVEDFVEVHRTGCRRIEIHNQLLSKSAVVLHELDVRERVFHPRRRAVIKADEEGIFEPFLILD